MESNRFFVSKDENLTKAHIRYLEGRLIEQARLAERAVIKNSQGSGSKLPESDIADMEVFLEKMLQLLPALGIDALVSAVSQPEASDTKSLLICKIKDISGTGYLTPNGIVVLAGSKAVLKERPASKKYPWVLVQRQKLIKDGSLLPEGTALVFTKDIEFSSPSAAAAVIHGGSTNGLTAWKNSDGKTLKELESE